MTDGEFPPTGRHGPDSCFVWSLVNQFLQLMCARKFAESPLAQYPHGPTELYPELQFHTAACAGVAATRLIPSCAMSTAVTAKTIGFLCFFMTISKVV